ncbi:MAG: hypothetical protein QM601_10455 [Pseudoxanthomonas sp.]
MSDASTPAALQRWAGGLLLLVALGLAAFYVLAFVGDNRAPLVDLGGYRAGGDRFAVRVERCVLAPEMVLVRGWAVRRGQDAPRMRARVVMVDAAGRARELDTVSLPREDLQRTLQAALGDDRQYRVPGFAASLDLHRIARPVSPVRLLLAWQQGEERFVLPLACKGKLP